MVSIYPHIFDTKNGTDIELMEILLGIKSGRWEDDCYPIMKEEDKVKRNELKKKVPYYTVSGTFEVRSNNGLRKHSGYISIDFDNVVILRIGLPVQRYGAGVGNFSHLTRRSSLASGSPRPPARGCSRAGG
jgi:hypothetical protein